LWDRAGRERGVRDDRLRDRNTDADEEYRGRLRDSHRRPAEAVDIEVRATSWRFVCFEPRPFGLLFALHDGGGDLREIRRWLAEMECGPR
jgi:hypothetical protein